MSQEAIEILRINSHKLQSDEGMDGYWIPKLFFDQALDLLHKQPVCKTCGGSGKTFPIQKQTENVSAIKIICPICKGTGISPDCTPPEASEFTKEIRAKLDHLDDVGYKVDGYWAHRYAEPQRDTQIFEDIREACTRLDQLETDLADVKLELSTPETAGMEKEPLYKWAAMIVCAKHDLETANKAQADYIETLIQVDKKVHKFFDECPNCKKRVRDWYNSLPKADLPEGAWEW